MSINNPYFWFDNPCLPAQIMKNKTDIEKIVETLKAISGDIERLQAYVDRLDDTVRAEVLAQLTEMTQDGTIRTIIEAIAGDYLETVLNSQSKSSTLDFRRLFRLVFNNGVNHSNYNETQRDNCFSYGQGTTFFTREGNDYFVTAFARNNGVSSATNDRIVRLYQIIDNAPSLVGELRLNVEHGESLCYNPDDDYIYIVHLRSNTTDIYNTTITRIKFNCFVTGVVPDSDIEVGNFPESVLAWSRINGIACNDGKLFIAGTTNTNNVVITQITWAIGESPAPVTGTDVIIGSWGSGSALQDFSVNDKYYAFLGSNSNIIRLYSRETGLLIWRYIIPTVLNDNMYRTNELESITLMDNGDLFITSSGHLNPKSFSAYSTNQYFKQNIYNNMWIPSGSNVSTTEGRFANVYVDYTVSASVPNPDGTESRPFGYIAEAIEYVEDNPTITSAGVVINNNQNHSPLYVSSPKTIYFRSGISGEKIKIGGVYVRGCPNIGFQSIAFDSIAPANLRSENLKEYSLYILASNFELYNCKYMKTYATEGKVYINRSVGNISNASGDSDYDSDISPVNITHSLVNGHGQITLSGSVVK